MKLLLVGDVHAVAGELDDCQRLINGVEVLARQSEPDAIVFMGDQHHNHRLVDVEVMAFWRDAFYQLQLNTPSIIALVGNHDMPGDASSKAHAMRAYTDLVDSVSCPQERQGVLFVPYQHTAEAFLDAVKRSPCKTVICHQTLLGSKYENGIYAKDGDGVDITGLEDRTFIVGHIHTPQKYANVVYVGAPRWRSVSDVGVDRAVFLIEINDGQVDWSKTRLFDTSKWCQKLVRIEDRQEAPATVDLNPAWKYLIDIYGSEDFIKSRLPVWAGCRTRTFKTIQAKAKKVSESMGIHKAIRTFVDSYQPKYGTSLSDLYAMVNKRISL